MITNSIVTISFTTAEPLPQNVTAELKRAISDMVEIWLCDNNVQSRNIVVSVL